jgi:hypothetical protein
MDRQGCTRSKIGCFTRGTLVEYRTSEGVPEYTARIFAFAVKERSLFNTVSMPVLPVFGSSFWLNSTTP